MRRQKPTAEDVRAFRDRHECGLNEAKKELEALWRRDCLYDIRMQAGALYTVEACRDVIVELIDLLRET